MEGKEVLLLLNVLFAWCWLVSVFYVEISGWSKIIWFNLLFFRVSKEIGSEPRDITREIS